MNEKQIKEYLEYLNSKKDKSSTYTERVAYTDSIGKLKEILK